MDGQDKKHKSSGNKENKKKNQRIFIVSSISALLVVGGISYFVLNRIKEQKTSAEGFVQEQFEGVAEISSQLQSECQQSALKLSKLQDLSAIENEYRQHAENCKDVYFAIDSESKYRKEGMYADLVVDIANDLMVQDKAKAVALLKYARELKSWDFYLGPVSCDSHPVLDAYIESYEAEPTKECLRATDLKKKFTEQIATKDFNFLASLVPSGEVVWLGMPETDVGCPEKISSIVKIAQKLVTGAASIDETASLAPNENNHISLNIKLSDKETLSFVFASQKSNQGEAAEGLSAECLKLSTVLVPNLEPSE